MRERLRRWLASAGQLALSAGLLWMGLDLAHAQSAPAPTTTATVDAAALFQQHCASCHGTPPTAQGKHANTGKVIAPLAPAFNAKAFTDTAKVDNIREMLRRGNYPLDPRKIAESIVELEKLL